MVREMAILRKFARATEIIVPHDSVPLSARISKDGGVFADTEAKPERVSKGFIRVDLNSDEMTAARITITIDHIPWDIETFSVPKDRI